MLAVQTPSSCHAGFAERDAAEFYGWGHSLASLDATDLGERFYSWRGASGARYICSVFPAAEASVVAGFNEGVVIGVRRDAASVRPICILCAADFSRADAGGIAAQDVDVDEWHIYFAGGAHERRDLAWSLLA